MQALWSPLLVFVALCAAACVGFFVNARLPEKHRSRDTIELVQLLMSLLVTFTAIVLGLLTTSVKSGFEAAYEARGAYAGRLAQLDRCLRTYGPETEPARQQLHAYVAAVIASTWPSEPPPKGVPFPDTAHMQQTGEDPVLAELINDIGVAVRSLQPGDTFHRNQASACTAQYDDMIKSRWTVIEGIHGSISAPFYWVLMFWLVILFACFGLRAPPTKMSLIVIALCALSVSSAIFIILDMDFPYGGLFGISSESMRNALADMMR